MVVSYLGFLEPYYILSYLIILSAFKTEHKKNTKLRKLKKKKKKQCLIKQNSNKQTNKQQKNQC